MKRTMMRNTMNLGSGIAIVVAVLSLSLATPGLAVADNHDEKHGPMPAAIVGTIFGGAIWLVSTPFCVLFAPMHIMESFDALVATPWRVTIGSDD